MGVEDRRRVAEVLERTRQAELRRVSRSRRRSSSVRWFPLVMVSALVLLVGVCAGVGYTGREALVTAARDWGSAAGDTETGDLPTGSVITDAEGNRIAQVFDQYRLPVHYDQISQPMKDAIVAIEDKRFASHGGVDVQGTIAAALSNVKGGGTRGASTLEQQFAKNYRWLVTARTDEERQAAIAQTLERKLRDIQSALKMDQELSKEDILTLYLNIVPFGHNTFGVDAASRVYFGIPASRLTVPQAAMLAGMVQSPEYNNPYTYPDHARSRRDVVLSVMRDQGRITGEVYDAAVAAPLGVLREPRKPGTGCITNARDGHFCDYVLEYLASHGIDADTVARGGLTIRTTLDPQAQASADAAVKTKTPQDPDGVQSLLTLIRPGDDRQVVAMVSSRPWGLDSAAGQTSLNSATLNVGDGAGSVFKVFTAAAYLERGGSVSDSLPTPAQATLYGMGSSDTAGCPEGAWCVRNVGAYPSSMTLSDALAKSPNTTFANLVGEVGVERVVDQAVRLGLRSYAVPGRDGSPSLRDRLVAANQGAFTLGFTPVMGVEMSNVAATLSSGGRWCEPNPVAEVRDRDGRPVPIRRPGCEEAVSPQVAAELSKGLSHDTVDGTAADSAKAMGWTTPVSAKTGTTEIHRSSSFLGYTASLAGFVYTFSDGPSPVELCSSPLRTCPGGGDLYGGLEPAQMWFSAVAPVRDRFGPSGLGGQLR